MRSTGARARVSVAIRDPEHGSFLVLPGGVLPGFDVDAASPWQVVAPVNDAVRADLGCAVTTLRAAWSSDPRDERLYEAVLRDGPVPSSGSWYRPDDLAGALGGTATSHALRMAIDGGALSPADGHLQPWYVPGWLAGMEDWIEERLAEAGLRRHGEIRQIRSWGRSALFRVETDRGGVWAKEVPESFSHEIAVTGMLADLDPGLVPPIIAADQATCRLLMSDVDGPLLSEVADQGAWEATLARIGETQRVLASELDRLTVAGVASAPLERLAEDVPGLLGDDELLRVGLDGGLDRAAAETLAARSDDLAEACRDLAASGLPDSLDHGDLSATQVIVGAMGPVIFDWSDASVTHPFLAAASFHAGSAAGEAETGRDAVEAYLAIWRAYGDRARLDVTYRSATLVAPLHTAQLYRDRILPGLEQRWEMDRIVPGVLAGLVRGFRSSATSA